MNKKWLLAWVAVVFMVAPAMAGEDPYIGIVGNDCVPGAPNPFGVCPGPGGPGAGVANPFYFSPKYIQFLYDQEALDVPVCSGTVPAANEYLREGGTGCESFFAQQPTDQPEICDESGSVLGPGRFEHRGNANSRITAGNTGWYEWWIRLPKKPDGQINLVIQCGILKPNAFAVYDFDAINLCAAETGERIGTGVCVRKEVDPGTSPVIQTALPRLKAIAYPGPYNSFVPFNLTAFKNPGGYTLTIDSKTLCMANNGSMQILDGGPNARILLKACMDKTVVTKLPVTGECNALLQRETDLEAGDLIYIRLDVPRGNTVDIYCHAQSARLAGVGEAPF